MAKKSETTACKECGVLVSVPLHLGIGQYRCPRCEGLLYRRGQPFSHVIVMALAALTLFLPLLFLPILDLNIMGQENSATLFKAFWVVYKDGYYLIALLALWTGILAPVAMLVLLLAILLPIHFGHRPHWIRHAYRLYETMREWGMAEVYLISIVVSMVKLHGMGTLHIGPGFYIFILFFLTFFITTVWFNPDDIWLDDALEN
ncbi:MAG: paraquat-inducible protein A [Epsilonproteobacteria bacterium]|nr:paraquat-inducible protein A [Campylobacterota bacterium]